MGVPVTRFTHTHHSDSSYVWVGGRYFSAVELGLKPGSTPNEKTVLELYRYFNVTKPPRDKAGKLRGIADLLYNEIPAGLDLEKICHKDR